MIVVLGPGLAPGLASLGVLAALEERNVPIERVVGVNTGALAAALWAVRSDLSLAARVIASLPWHRYVVSRDLASADPLFSALNVLTRARDVSEAERPLAVVAADEESGEPVFVQSGNIAWAVRASLAVPGLFHPLEEGGRRLVDGGCVWPLDSGTLPEGRRLVVAHRSFATRLDGAPQMFSGLSLQLAHLASRSWGKSSSTAGELLVVSEQVGGLLDFHLAESWFEAGWRAFQQWLSPAGGGVDG